jgi:ACS family glucarate transporter-like MFS transporter
MKIGSQMPRFDWAVARVLVGGFLAFFIFNMVDSSFATLLALIKEEFFLTYTASGLLMASYWLGFTLGPIPSGYLSDKIGYKYVITTCILGIALSTVLFGMANSIWLVFLARFLSGLLSAGIFVPLVSLVSKWFSPGFRGTALGILTMGGSLSHIAFAWISPYTALHLGWRLSIVAFGIVSVISTILIWSLLMDPDTEVSSSKPLQDISSILHRIDFWILGIVQFFRLGSNYTFGVWLPLILKEEFGLSLIAAGAMSSIFSFSAMISNPVGGLVSDRIGETVVMITSFTILGLVTIAFNYVKVGYALILLIISLGCFVNFLRSPIYTLIPRLYGVEISGRITGIHSTFGSIGALLLPLFLGYVRDATSSYRMGWTALALLLISNAFLVLFLIPSLKKREEPG